MALRYSSQKSQLWKLDFKILGNKQWAWLNHLIQDQYQILRKPSQTSQKKCQFLMLLKKRQLKWMIFIQSCKISLRNLINLLTSVIWKWQSWLVQQSNRFIKPMIWVLTQVWNKKCYLTLNLIMRIQNSQLNRWNPTLPPWINKLLQQKKNMLQLIIWLPFLLGLLLLMKLLPLQRKQHLVLHKVQVE